MGLSSSKKRNRRAKRDANAVASPTHQSPLAQLLSPLAPLKPLAHRVTKNLGHIEDRRSWHPKGVQAPAKSVHKAQHRLVAKPNKAPRGSAQRISEAFRARAAPPVAVGFHAPKKVVICVRRRMRKEVLFALNRTGKGAKKRKHRRSYYSDVRCT